jgi:D-sedoheptulose 7-phosphate isomerase
LEEKIEELKKLLEWTITIKPILNNVVAELKEGFRNQKKLLICGNGGSAEQSLHLSAELLVRYKKTREPMPAISLVYDIPTITAISNDFSYNEIFSRQIKALGNEGDFLFAFSTSGNSVNVNLAVEMAYKKNMKIVYFTGQNKPKVSHLCKYIFNVPSYETARIQEIHLFLIHLICDGLEND